MTLSWHGDDKADKYVVTVGPDRALQADPTTIDSNETTITIDDLVASHPGTDQYFRIDAIDNETVVSSRVGRFALLPAKQSALKVKKLTFNGVKLSWKKVANARQFDFTVARDKKFSKGVKGGRTLNDKATFVASGLKADTKYWVKVRPVNSDHLGAFGPAISFTTLPREFAFRAATWNVCSESCSGYSSRAPIQAAFLNANKVDIFGLQESGGVRIGAVTKSIFSGGSQGFRRATGGAKARYIFYRPVLFQQNSGGYFAVGHGRHATWARFTVKDTGRQFFFVNVHLENGHGNDSKRASEMRVLLGRMARINDTGLPMIYAGDFNSGRHRSSDSPGALMRGAGMSDTVELADNPINARINSGHTFSTSVLTSGAHVDHIYVSKEFEVDEWKQLVRITNGRYTTPVVSDHNAISAVLALDAPTEKVGKATVTTRVTELGASLR